MKSLVLGKKLLAVAAISTLIVQANAAIVNFDLMGTAGAGLLAGNEPQPLGSPSTASGGEIGAGIFFDTSTSRLTVNVGWGSSQGFLDLSSTSTASHIHGPTLSNGGAGFTQTAGVLINLTRSANAITGGVFTDPPILLTPAQQTDLFNGKYYINIHTLNNGGGELRGFLVMVPEPTTASLFGIGMIGLAAHVCRRGRANRV